MDISNENSGKTPEEDNRESLAKQVKLIYGILVVSLIVLYVAYIPHLLDYYVMRPQESFWDFYQRNLLDSTYVFEGVILGLVLAGLYCATMNAGVSVLISAVALFVLTHAGYLKYLNRRELLRLDDLRLTEVAGMLDEYVRFEYSSFLLMLAGTLLASVAVGFGAEFLRRRFCSKAAPISEKTERFRRFMPIARVLGVLLICGTLAGYTHGYFVSKMRWDAVDAVNPVNTDSNRYVLYQFLRNDSLISVSAEDVEESRAFLTEQGAVLAGASDSAVCPNVIVIMNESWWNTDWLDPDRITFSKDPMEPYKQLEGQCVGGYLTSNIYGGGTVSSEAEFLTGLNTKYYVSDAAIYAKTRDRKLPSVVDYFEALDYETTAIHPYYGEFYSRDQVYPNMGFDNIIFDEDMLNRELYTRYISDDSLADEIIERYENSESERQFIWAVSIGNHGLTLNYHEGYVEGYEYPISVALRDELESETEHLRLVNYVNGIYLANQAYARLVEYFAGREEPVILVMYGDHIPNFSKEIYDALGFDTDEPAVGDEQIMVEIGATDAGEETQTMQIVREPLLEDTLSPDQSRTVYSVPVLLYSNASAEELSCRGEKPTFTGEGIYYLPQIILDYAGLPESDMTLALRYERSLFKTNSRAIVLDAEGEPVQQCTQEQVNGLRYMQVMEYDIMLGEGLCHDIWNPVKKK